MAEVLTEMRQQVLERVQEHLSFHMNEPIRMNRLDADARSTGVLNLTDVSSRDKYFANNFRAFPSAAMM